MSSNFHFFIAYLQKRIRDGERQVDIAKSPTVNRSTAYINKLYKAKGKSCHIGTQKGIAQYFGVSYQEMLKEGRKIFLSSDLPEERNIDVDNDESYSSSELLRHLKIVANGIKKQAFLLEGVGQQNIDCIKYRQKLDLYTIIFENIDEGITFFDANQRIVFSSNLYGLLDEVDIATATTLPEIVAAIAKKVSMPKEEIASAWAIFDSVYLKKERASVTVKFDEDHQYLMRLKPVFKNKKFIGIIVINTIVKIRKEE